MLQVTIPLADFHAELKRRIDNLRKFRCLGGSPASFGGNAQAKAIEISQQGDAPMSTTTIKPAMQRAGEDAALNLITEFCNDDKIQAGKIMAAAILQGCNADAANTAFREWLEGFCEVIGNMFAAHCYNHQFTIRTVTESEGGEA